MSFYGRLLEEKQELDNRLAKLNSFLENGNFNGVSAAQIALLNVQSHTMAAYSQILTERIALLSADVTSSLDEGSNPTTPPPPPPPPPSSGN